MFKKAVTLILFISLIIVPCRSTLARIIDKIVAIVNNEVITQSEVDRVLYPIYLEYKKLYKTEEEVYKRLDKHRLDILRELINDKLILSEARRIEIEVSEKEVDERLDEVKKGLQGKGADLDFLLKEQNLTITDLRNKYRDHILIQKTIDREIKRRIDVQPSEVSNYYSAHKDDYTQPEQVAVYTILIKIESERAPIESRQLASDIREMLKEGRDFKELALNYSEGPAREEGGDLGYVKRGQLLREIDNVIFFLKVGEISDVIESPIGYHIFKVYDRKEEKVLLFEDIRQKVTETLYRIKMQEKFESWLEKLKSNAYIAIK